MNLTNFLLLFFTQINLILQSVQALAYTPELGTINVFDSSNTSVAEMPSQEAVMTVGDLANLPDDITGFIMNAYPENFCQKINFRTYRYYRRIRKGILKLSKNMNITEEFVWILICNDLDCSSQQKIDNAKTAGFGALIIYNTVSNDTEVIGKWVTIDQSIPTFSVGNQSGILLRNQFNCSNGFYVKINAHESLYRIIVYTAIWIAMMVVFLALLYVCFKPVFQMLDVTCVRRCSYARRQGLLAKALEKFPIISWTSELHINYETCVICLENFLRGDSIRILSCSHGFHSSCIDAWLYKGRRFCPICKDKFKYARPWDCSSTGSEMSSGNYVTNHSRRRERNERSAPIPGTSGTQNQHQPTHSFPRNDSGSSSLEGQRISSLSLSCSLSSSLFYSTEFDSGSAGFNTQSSPTVRSEVAYDYSNSFSNEQWYSYNENDQEIPASPVGSDSPSSS